MPSMGGSATLISAPRYGDLTNVDTTGQADQQIFGWDQASGTYKPLVGVTGNGGGGVVLHTTDSTTTSVDASADGQFGVGVAGAAHDPSGIGVYGYTGTGTGHAIFADCDANTDVAIYCNGAIHAKGGQGVFDTIPPVAQPAITGALSTVADAPAKAVLTSIIAALVGCGLASDGTT